MDILRKHEESAGGVGGSSKRTPTGSMGGSLDEMRESIMKVIRTHIEQNKLPYNQEGAGGIGAGGGGDTSSYLINAAAGTATGGSRKKYLINPKDSFILTGQSGYFAYTVVSYRNESFS